MGRMLIADLAVQRCIETFVEGNSWNIGLVVGQLSPQKDYVLHLISSKTVIENDSDENFPMAESLEGVSDQTIASHSRQVKRMLTGGLDVIGVFVVDETESLKALQGKFRQIVFCVHKALSKSEFAQSCHLDRCLLQICSRTKNLTCRTFNVKDPKSCAEPCEWKFQKTADTFLNLSTSFTLESTIPVPSTALSHTLQKQLTNGLQQVYQNIWNSLATVNDRVVDDDSRPICPKTTSEQNRGRGGRKVAKDDEQGLRLETFDINLLQEMGREPETSGVPETKECGAKLVIRGTISSRAHAHFKLSAAEAVQALKRDIIRSIGARCELLCDDLLQTEEEQDVRVLYEMPQRVYCCLPQTNVRFCDYLFQDETLEDSADRFRVLLGISVSAEDIDSSAERIPEDSDLARPVRVADIRRSRTPPELLEALKPATAWKFLGATVAASVAILSVWLMTQEGFV